MKNAILYPIVLLVLMSCADNRQVITTKIQTILKEEKGTFAVAFKDLQTGEEILINEHQSFHAASTMKTPVMIEVYKRASQGKFSLNDSIVVKNEFKSIVDGSAYQLSPDDDSDQELYNHIGKKMTIGELMYRMIIVSSNLATNMIIELVDPKSVTATMRELGANDIKVLRGVEDGKAFEKGLINETSAFDLMLIFEKMAKGDIVDKTSCDEMVRILFDQKFNEIIPGKLPKDVRVAHKTGNITGVRHDSGIVLLPDGRRYVLVLLSKELEDEKAGIEAMATVSEIIYQYVTQGV